MSETITVPLEMSDMALLTIACARADKSPPAWCSETLHGALHKPPTNDMTPLLADVIASLGTVAANIQQRAAAAGFQIGEGTPIAGTAGTGPATLPPVPPVVACPQRGDGPTPSCGWPPGISRSCRGAPAPGYAERRSKKLYL
jgi:hypothetical protein